MPTPLVFAVFIALIHLAIFFTSGHTSRIIKAYFGTSLAVAGFVCGLSIQLIMFDPLTQLILAILTPGLPVVSLLIYLPSLWQRAKKG